MRRFLPWRREPATLVAPSAGDQDQEGDHFIGAAEMEFEDEGVEHTDFIQNMKESVRVFKQQRAALKTLRYHQVISKAMQMLMFSVALHTLFTVVLVGLNPVMVHCLLCACKLLIVSGVISASVCPLDELSIDDYLQSSYKSQVVLICFTFTVAALTTIRAGAPYLHALVVVMPFTLIIRRKRVFEQRSPAASLLMTFFVWWQSLSWAVLYAKMSLADDMPHPTMRMTQAAICFLATLVPVVFYCAAHVKAQLDGTVLFYSQMYAGLLIMGLKNGVMLIWLPARLEIIFSMVPLLPPVFVLVVGRDNVFGYMSRLFDREQSTKDGAFVAGLLASKPVEEGNVWWVPRQHPSDMYAANDHRRHFIRGRVEHVRTSGNEYYIDVRLPPASLQFQPFGGTGAFLSSPCSAKVLPALMEDPIGRGFGQVRTVCLYAHHETSEVMLDRAMSNLRCVDFSTLSMELLIRASSVVVVPEGSLFNFSRPLEPGEKIDFFLSHSWHDDARAKWSELVKVAASFRAQRGRFPTIWLDKLCIDSSLKVDGLKVLCANVLACDKVMVLLGPTYSSRLWCVWELFTVLAFQRLESALAQVMILPLVGEGAAELAALQHFDMDHARCFDPNEEARLRRVICALSRSHFNEAVRDFGQKLAKRHARRMNIKYFLPRQAPVAAFDQPAGPHNAPSTPTSRSETCSARSGSSSSETPRSQPGSADLNTSRSQTRSFEQRRKLEEGIVRLANEQHDDTRQLVGSSGMDFVSRARSPPLTSTASQLLMGHL